MKIDILIVDIAVVLAVFLPYVGFILVGKYHDRKLKKIFFQEAKKRNMDLEEIGRWNVNWIGIDRKKSRVLLIQRFREATEVSEIHLQRIQACSVLPRLKRVRLNNRTEEVLQGVDLELDLWNGEKEYVTLFDSSQTTYQEFEQQNAEKWSKIINEHLVLRPALISAA